MRTILHYIGEIREFLNDKTDGTAGKVSNAVLKRLLMEAYNSLPFLLPLRLIITAEQFADYLIEKKEDLFNESPSKKRRTTRKTSTSKTTRRKSTTTKTGRTRKPTTQRASPSRRSPASASRQRASTRRSSKTAPQVRTVRRRSGIAA